MKSDGLQRGLEVKFLKSYAQTSFLHYCNPIAERQSEKDAQQPDPCPPLSIAPR